MEILTSREENVFLDSSFMHFLYLTKISLFFYEKHNFLIKFQDNSNKYS
jgi:hypothetical protein